MTAAGSRRAMRELLEFQTKTAWVVRDNVVVPVPASELVAGDEVVVYPGEMIPVDGEILDGHAMIDQKTITGEGLPVMRGQGRSGVCRDRHPRRPGHGPRDSRRRRHHGRPDRAARSNPRRSAIRGCKTTPSGSLTDWCCRRWRLRAAPRRRHRRFQPFPVACDCGLRHRHPRRRPNRGAVVDDARRAGRHHHQERRAHGAASPKSIPSCSTRPAR